MGGQMRGSRVKGSQHGGRTWFRLDNAAKLYPAIANGRWQSFFRFSLTLDETVDPDTLEQAVNDTLERFPSMKVRLRRGVFWYYLEHNPLRCLVREETGHPCMRLREKENNGYLFRLIYYHQRVSIEMFHVLTDGTGGLIFLKNVVAQYLRLRGISVACTHGVVDFAQPPPPEETEDAHARLPRDIPHASRKESRAWQMPGTKEPPHTLHVVEGRMSVDRLKAKAGAMGVTITEYLVAVMIYCMYLRAQDMPGKKRPIKVSVLVNMRKFMGVSTMRNFSFYVNAGIDPRLGTYTLAEIANHVHHYMRYAMQPKLLFSSMATNVASERNVLIRIAPLFIKKLVLRQVFHAVGETLFSSVLTNVGVVELPEGMRDHVQAADMLLGPSVLPRCNCAAVSLNGTFTLTFTRNIVEPDFARDVLCFLQQEGIGVTVTSNQ